MILAQVPEGELFAEAFACAGIGALPFEAKANGATRFCMGAAWRGYSDRKSVV